MEFRLLVHSISVKVYANTDLTKTKRAEETVVAYNECARTVRAETPLISRG